MKITKIELIVPVTEVAHQTLSIHRHGQMDAVIEGNVVKLKLQGRSVIIPLANVRLMEYELDAKNTESKAKSKS